MVDLSGSCGGEMQAVAVLLTNWLLQCCLPADSLVDCGVGPLSQFLQVQVGVGRAKLQACLLRT